MSSDLMVFEKSKAPKTKKDFMDWYNKQTQWGEEHDYQTIVLLCWRKNTTWVFLM